MNKYILDGKVGVVLSSGWETWAEGSPEQQEFMLLDSNVVSCVLKEKYGEAADLVNEMFSESKGGTFIHSQKLRVVWVEDGKQFYISYDDDTCGEYLSHSIPIIFKT